MSRSWRRICVFLSVRWIYRDRSCRAHALLSDRNSVYLGHRLHLDVNTSLVFVDDFSKELFFATNQSELEQVIESINVAHAISILQQSLSDAFRGLYLRSLQKQKTNSYT